MISSKPIDLFASILTEHGRANNIMIPPSATRRIPLRTITRPPVLLSLDGKSAIEPNCIFVCYDELLMKSVFIPGGFLLVDWSNFSVPLYNGSHESYYVRDEQKIAELLIFP